MISLATAVVAGSLRFVMCRFVRADSSPAASTAISSGPNEMSRRASAWITSDIGTTFYGRDQVGDGATPAEMMVVNYDKGFAKISQRCAFRDRPVAPSLKPAPAGRAPRTRRGHLGRCEALLRPAEHGVEVLQRIAK